LFARYAAVVKNLRGVTLFDLGEEGSWDSVEWLVRRFRYRDLGVTPSVYRRYPGRLEKYMGGNPFRLLTYPIPELEGFTGEFSRCVGVEYEVAELLVLSSVYVSPAIVIGRRFEEQLGRLSVESVRTCRDLDTEDWKLHMRIADYTVLDMYEYAVSGALEVSESCSGGKLGEVLSARLELIRRDVRRYWRIVCGEPTARAFLYYVDNLRLYAQNCGLEGLCGRGNLSAALAVVPVITIPPGMH
jgi:hypothetical protein